jgi:hypothetical protein
VSEFSDQLRSAAKGVRAEWIGVYDDHIAAQYLDLAADRNELLETTLREAEDLLRDGYLDTADRRLFEHAERIKVLLEGHS